METPRITPFDGLGPEDMALPELKLVQGLGGEEARQAGAEVGDFYCSVTGEIYTGEAGVPLVVVRIAKNRTYWGRSEISDEPPVCASHDGIRNLGGELCSECPYNARVDASWLVSAQERRDKCNISYSILAINFLTQMPLLIRGSGISATPVRELFTLLSSSKTAQGQWHRAKVLMTSVVRKTQFGESRALKFKALELIEDEIMSAELLTMFRNLHGTQLLAEGAPVTKPEEIEAPKQPIPTTAGATAPQVVVPPPANPPSRSAPRRVEAQSKTIPAEHKTGAAPAIDF